MKKLLATLVTLVMIVSSLAVLTSCGAKDGVTPTIGENGNWFIGETDTGVPATGPKGDTGNTGATGPKGDTGATGPAGNNGAALEAPTFRYNEYKARYEYSFDGLNWIAIEEYDPASDLAAALRDTTLSSYSYPMEFVAPAEGTIQSSNGQYKVISGGKYAVALIDITGCVFDKVKLVANAESGNQPNWCFLTDMPTLGQVAPFCDGYTALAAPEDETATEVIVEIPEDAKVLAVYYRDYDWDISASIPYCPSSITFLKDGAEEEPAAPVIDPNLLDASLTEYAYPMNTITPAEGCIMLEGDNKNVYMVDPENPDHRVAFIYIEGTVFTGAKFTGNANNWMGWFWLDELPELGETIDYAGDMVNIHETSRGSGSQTGKVNIQEGAKWLCVWYQDDADGTAGSEVTNYLPEGILFVK